MRTLSKSMRHQDAPGIDTAGSGKPVEDISGFTVFSGGEPGDAHVMAHRMLDSGRFELGHRRLGAWFQGRNGAGSEWVHLHFHMAIFELELGEWNAAYSRFLAEVLPAAATSEDALTDAPALLWRLAIAAPAHIDLPWQPVRRTALACMQNTGDAFVQLHNLLALSGAGDVAGIDRWLESRPAVARSGRERLVEKMAVPLKALAGRSFQRAAVALRRILPDIVRVGGSHAQNQLFELLLDWSARQIDGAYMTPVYADAA